MSDFGFKISEVGVDVNAAGAKDLVVSSQFDTLKVKVSGTLTDSLPSETIAAGNNKSYTETVAHGLTGMPFYWPEIHDSFNNAYAGTSDFIVNDGAFIEPPIGPYSPWTSGEWCEVFIDSTNLTLRTNRLGHPLMGTTFGAHDVIYYYTIFFNRMDEEVDYS